MKMMTRAMVVAGVMVCLAASAAPCGRVALHTWYTSAEFKDITVTGADGKTLFTGPGARASNDPIHRDIAK